CSVQASITASTCNWRCVATAGILRKHGAASDAPCFFAPAPPSPVSAPTFGQATAASSASVRSAPSALGALISVPSICCRFGGKRSWVEGRRPKGRNHNRRQRNPQLSILDSRLLRPFTAPDSGDWASLLPAAYRPTPARGSAK